ncbi:hypothetical protein [Nocardia amamiensis]
MSRAASRTVTIPAGRTPVPMALDPVSDTVISVTVNVSNNRRHLCRQQW